MHVPDCRPCRTAAAIERQIRFSAIGADGPKRRPPRGGARRSLEGGAPPLRRIGAGGGRQGARAASTRRGGGGSLVVAAWRMLGRQRQQRFANTSRFCCDWQRFQPAQRDVARRQNGRTPHPGGTALAGERCRRSGGVATRSEIGSVRLLLGGEGGMCWRSLEDKSTAASLTPCEDGPSVPFTAVTGRSRPRRAQPLLS